METPDKQPVKNNAEKLSLIFMRQRTPRRETQRQFLHPVTQTCDAVVSEISALADIQQHSNPEREREREMKHVFHLYEAAVPQPGVDLESHPSREAREGTLKQDAAGGP